MENILFIIKALQDPWFWGFVVFPICFMLSIWPVIINKMEDKASRINKIGGKNV
jgi:hypothetical protein